jgi:hypothetical protein
MRSILNHQTIRQTCLFIAITLVACPGSSKADDMTNAAMPVSLTASEATNPPMTVTVPAITNLPATGIEVATTNGLTTTNLPPPAPVPVTTNESATATAPVSTNLPAITNLPAMAPAPVTPMVVMPPIVATIPLSKQTLPYQPFSLGAEVGTTGYGGAATWRLADHIGVVGGADYFNYTENWTIKDIPFSATLRLKSQRVGINLYPSRDSSFFVSLGVYFDQNQLTGTAVGDGSISINGTPIPNGDIVHFEYKQQPTDPYASIGGNLYFDRNHCFSFGFEVGAFYMGHPKIQVSDEQNQVDWTSYKNDVYNAINKVPVWPILKISLNFSF